MVNWGKAFELFFIGFGGVFVTLIILQLGISLYSKIINRIENMMKKKGQGGKTINMDFSIFNKIFLNSV